MWQTAAPKQGHECCLERSDVLKEVVERSFPTDRIAHQQREKIDRFIGAEASAHQTNLLCKGIEQIMCREVMGNDDLIARTREEPRDELQERFGPLYRGWVSYAERPPYERMVCFLLIRDLSSLFTLVAACQLVAHRVG